MIIVYAQFTTYLILYVLGISLIIFTLNVHTPNAVIHRSLLLGIVFFAFRMPFIKVFGWMAGLKFIPQGVKIKLEEIGLFLSGDLGVLAQQGNFKGYQDNYNLSLEGFLHSPLFGGWGELGGHHFWLDNAANFGIIGLVPWLVIMRFLSRKMIKTLPLDLYVVFNIGIILFIVFGILKNIVLGMHLVMFLIFPALLYIDSLKRKGNEYG